MLLCKSPIKKSEVRDVLVLSLWEKLETQKTVKDKLFHKGIVTLSKTLGGNRPKYIDASLDVAHGTMTEAEAAYP